MQTGAVFFALALIAGSALYITCVLAPHFDELSLYK
jgi:hypothetical protein